MSEKRLSNLQKWILVNCYRVTVLRERADRELARCDYFNQEKCCDNVTSHPSHPNIYNCKTRGYEGVPLACTAYEFTQNDVYRNYYRLELSRRLAIYTDTVYFKHTSESDKIYNSTMRTLENLKEKGFIIYSTSNGAKTIILTNTGKTVVEKLLGEKSVLAKPIPTVKNKKQRKDGIKMSRELLENKELQALLSSLREGETTEDGRDYPLGKYGRMAMRHLHNTDRHNKRAGRFTPDARPI